MGQDKFYMGSPKANVRWKVLLGFILVCLLIAVTYRRFTFGRAEERPALDEVAASHRNLESLMKQLRSEDAGSGMGDFPPWYGEPIPTPSGDVVPKSPSAPPTRP
jgi:hypothetical protein